METLEETELCFPQLINTSCRKPTRPHFETMLIYIVLSSISLLTAALNLLVIISISHFKQLHTPTNLLLLSLAVSDFFVGLLMFFQIMLIDGCWLLGDLMCSMYYVLNYIVCSASIGTMVLISVDRYLAICEPLRYPTKVNVRGVSLCICVCWACSVLYSMVMMKDNWEQPGRYKSCSGECVIFMDYDSGVATLFLSFIGPVTVIIVLYMRVFVVAVSQARAMRSHITVVTQQCSVKEKATKSEMKAARALSVVIIVFLICISPYFCVTLTGQDIMLNASSSAFVTCLVYFNSCLNPLIYTFFYRWFRKSVRLVVTLQIFKPDSFKINLL